MISSAGQQPPVSRVLLPVTVGRQTGAGRVEAEDVLAVEEPLEIRLVYGPDHDRTERAISITMRTPGHDAELAAGFLWTEGLIRAPEDLLHLHRCRTGNIVRAHLRPGVELDLTKLERNFYTTSSCGVCGKASLEAVRVCVRSELDPLTPNVSAEVIHQLPDKLRAVQAAFDVTGGLHASALFDATGTLIEVREDVGRHNALDKLIGRQLLDHRLPLVGSLLLVSGRASFELVQKAGMAGIPLLAAVGAPSSLAVQLADELGMTLLGFVRQNRFNIYCGGQRVDGLGTEPPGA